MSVKQMSVEQLREDLALIAIQWPGGIPTEQYDRVNALKTELKRRGEDILPPQKRVTAEKDRIADRDPADMSEEQLTKELKRLSQHIGVNPKDEDAQERFADVRYHLRKRSRSNEDKRQVEASDDASDGEEMPTPKANGRRPEVAEKFDASDEATDDGGPEPATERRVPRKAEPASTSTSTRVTFDAEATSANKVLVTCHLNTRDVGGAGIAVHLSVVDAEVHIAKLQAAVDKIKGS